MRCYDLMKKNSMILEITDNYDYYRKISELHTVRHTVG